MHAHFEPHATHTDRLADVLLAVDDELLRQHVQHLLVGRDIDRLGGLDDARDVARRNFAILDRHHAARVEALDMAARNAGERLLDLACGHQFGFLECTTDRLHGRLDVDDDAPAQTLRRGLTETDHLQAAVGQRFRDRDDHLRGADVQADDQVFGFGSHGSSQRAFVSEDRGGADAAMPLA